MKYIYGLLIFGYYYLSLLYSFTNQPRSEAIATFALCGFANICSMGIQIGGLGALAPKRKSELAGMAFRSMLAGSLVTFLNACLAGLLYSDDLSIPHSNTTLLVT